MRAVRALGALGVLAALLIGVPYLLATLGNPGHLLQIDWLRSLTSAGDSRLVLALLSVIGWLAWLVVAVTVVFEFVAVASRQRIRLRLPGTGWFRPAIAALVLAAVASPGIASADDPAPPPVVDLGTPVPTRHAEAENAPSAEPRTRTYTVEAGDELWSVAERELGDGVRWREIVELNPGIDDSLRIEAGQRLRLPVDEAAVASAGTADSVVVVQRDDSLWQIAERTLGDGEHWPQIYELNRDQIADPDQIDVGWVLRLPDPPAMTNLTPTAAERRALPTPELVPQTPPETQQTRPEPDDSAREAEQTPAPENTPLPVHTEAAAVPTLPTSAPVSPPPETADPEHAAAERSVDESGPDLSALLGPMGALLAAGVVAGVATRRRTQLLARALGRRSIPVTEQTTRFWGALASHSDSADDPSPREQPTSVVLGWDAEEVPVAIDLEAERATVFHGPAAGAAVSSLVTSLSSAPWSEGVQLVLVDGADWADALEDPRIGSVDGSATGLAELSRTCSQRRVEMRSSTLEQLRADHDLASVWSPIVFVFTQSLTPTDLDAVGDALSLGAVGVSVVAQCTDPPHLQAASISIDEESAQWGASRFTPQLVTAPARRGLIELFRTAGSVETERAPWWRDTDDLPPNVLPLPRVEANAEEHPMPEPPSQPEYPTLLLLGEVELLATAGTRPTRAISQCMEYCAWLLSNPGATPTVMVSELLVAETTRRSNMSRLRTWLGDADDGAPFLPDAYSGRIKLDERVTSDWERFEAMLAGGVNMASSAALRAALRMVRGEPLGSLAFQWHWAQSLRSDMVAMIVDAACVLADRAIEHSDTNMALWAVGRGRLASPESDLLSVREIHALAAAGRRPQLERAIVVLNRSIRAAGRDLDPELARRVQYAIHLSSNTERETAD